MPRAGKNQNHVSERNFTSRNLSIGWFFRFVIKRLSSFQVQTMNKRANVEARLKWNFQEMNMTLCPEQVINKPYVSEESLHLDFVYSMILLLCYRETKIISCSDPEKKTENLKARLKRDWKELKLTPCSQKVITTGLLYQLPGTQTTKFDSQFSEKIQEEFR